MEFPYPFRFPDAQPADYRISRLEILARAGVLQMVGRIQGPVFRLLEDRSMEARLGAGPENGWWPFVRIHPEDP